MNLVRGDSRLISSCRILDYPGSNRALSDCQITLGGSNYHYVEKVGFIYSINIIGIKGVLKGSIIGTYIKPVKSIIVGLQIQKQTARM